MKRSIGVLILCLILAAPAYGQKFTISTNMANYLNFVTMNLEGSYAAAQHWSITAGVKYNPFTFHFGDKQLQNRQQSYSLGVRYWPWHIYSGWWVAGKLQYQEYNVGGIISDKTEEGDKWGAGFTGGYTYMISSHFNLEFGLGFWGGVKEYTTYSCPSCGLTKESGTKAFIYPNDIIIGITYVF